MPTETQFEKTQASSKPIREEPAPHKNILHNRVQTLMIHTTRYAFQGQARLAHDAGVSRSTISRLLSGKTAPSFRLAQAVTNALARILDSPLDTADLFSQDGCYREPSGCALCGCDGCLPDAAYDRRGNRRPEWKNARPGDWSCAPQVPAVPQVPTVPQQQVLAS